MKRTATTRKVNHRRHTYTKGLENRKHPVRGLWHRNERFLARIIL